MILAKYSILIDPSSIVHGVLRGYSMIPCIMLQGRSHDSNGKVDDVLPSARIQDILAVATWVRFVGHKVSLFLATKWRFLFSFCIPESRPEDGFGNRVPGLRQCANGQATPCSQHFVTMDSIASICILEYLSKLEHEFSQASKVTGFEM